MIDDRAIYIEMLGQDASFAYIRAVELCASTNIFQKRVGFLACKCCFLCHIFSTFMNCVNDYNRFPSCNVTARLPFRHQHRYFCPQSTSSDSCWSIRSNGTWRGRSVCICMLPYLVWTYLPSFMQHSVFARYPTDSLTHSID